MVLLHSSIIRRKPQEALWFSAFLNERMKREEKEKNTICVPSGEILAGNRDEIVNNWGKFCEKCIVFKQNVTEKSLCRQTERNPWRSVLRGSASKDRSGSGNSSGRWRQSPAWRRASVRFPPGQHGRSRHKIWRRFYETAWRTSTVLLFCLL